MTDSSLALYSTSGPKKDLALHYVHPDSDDEEEYEIETSKIESQRSAWADFMRELPSEDFTEDPELWQYWRLYDNAKHSDRTSAFSKKMAKMFNIGHKKIRKQQALKNLIRGGVPQSFEARFGMLPVEQQI